VHNVFINGYYSKNEIHHSETTEVKIIKRYTDPQSTIPNYLVLFEEN